jgi:hypothetical protein
MPPWHHNLSVELAFLSNYVLRPPPIPSNLDSSGIEGDFSEWFIDKSLLTSLCQREGPVPVGKASRLASGFRLGAELSSGRDAEFS